MELGKAGRPVVGGRRLATALAAVAAVAVLAGCGGGGKGAAPRAPGALPQGSTPLRGSGTLARALRAWSGFPVAASPRPLVLTGAPVADPPRGFPDGAAKLAYLERAVTVLAALPSGPRAAGGYPLIGPAAALRVFLSSAAKGPSAAARLKLTAIRLGAGTFQTDRGPRRLPAWLLRFKGVPGAAAVLAVSPARLVPLSPAFGASRQPVVMSAQLGDGGRTLTATFVGMPAGKGPCTADYRLDVAESREAVAVAVRARVHGNSNLPCSLVGYRRRAATVLSAPLGARVLVDAASGMAVPVLQGTGSSGSGG